MKKKSILHITPWFPQPDDPMNALWIARHIKSLEPHCTQHLLHLDENLGKRLWKQEEEDGLTRITLRANFNSWRFREWRVFRSLKKFLKEKKAIENFDVVNFHIAYPNCVYLDRLRKFLPGKILFTEHWSYYHFHFHSRKKLTHIKNIFAQNIPVICVSEALARDIRTFSGHQFPVHIVPNVVETDAYRFAENVLPGKHFFMAARWKSPKTPLEILKAISELKKKNIEINLRIAGFGDLVPEILHAIQTLHLSDEVKFIGALNKYEMATEHQTAKGFILPTSYETFSVVCAEALCCGCPVLSEPHGAIPELVNNENGMLRGQNERWEDAILRFVIKDDFDRKKISENATSLYNMTTIGEQYAAVINNVK